MVAAIIGFVVGFIACKLSNKNRDNLRKASLEQAFVCRAALHKMPSINKYMTAKDYVEAEKLLSEAKTAAWNISWWINYEEHN